MSDNSNVAGYDVVSPHLLVVALNYPHNALEKVHIFGH